MKSRRWFLFYVRQRNKNESQQTAKSTAHTLGTMGRLRTHATPYQLFAQTWAPFPRHGLSLDKSSLFGPFGISAR